jgi:hypothetical protein
MGQLSIYPCGSSPPNVKFVGKAGAYLNGASLKCRLLASPANTPLGRKGLREANALAYLVQS